MSTIGKFLIWFMAGSALGVMIPLGYGAEQKPLYDIKVSIDRSRNGPHLVRGEAVYPTPFETVWNGATDFARYRLFVPHMIRSEVLQIEPELRVRFDFRNQSPVPDFWNALGVQVVKGDGSGEIRWKLVDGDIRRNEGKLRLEQIPKIGEKDVEKTRVILEVQVDIGALYPQFLVAMVAKKEVPKTLNKFGRRVAHLERVAQIKKITRPPVAFKPRKVFIIRRPTPTPETNSSLKSPGAARP